VTRDPRKEKKRILGLGLIPRAQLIGMLMFGNLLRESGVTQRLSKTAGSSLIDIVTIFLGLAVGATMQHAHFLNYKTLMILVLGAVAFSFSTARGVIFAKIINLFLISRQKDQSLHWRGGCLGGSDIGPCGSEFCD